MNNISLMALIGRLTSIESTINLLLFIALQVSTGKITIIVEVDTVFSINLVIPSLKKNINKDKVCLE